MRVCVCQRVSERWREKRGSEYVCVCVLDSEYILPVSVLYVTIFDCVNVCDRETIPGDGNLGGNLVVVVSFLFYSSLLLSLPLSSCLYLFTSPLSS